MDNFSIYTALLKPFLSLQTLFFGQDMIFCLIVHFPGYKALVHFICLVCFLI